MSDEFAAGNNAAIPKETPIVAGPVPNNRARMKAMEAEAEAEAKLVQGRLWLLSFTDLFSILLCFFMMMYSMKDPDMEKVGKMGGRKTYDLMEGAGKRLVVGTSSSTGTFSGAGINQVEYGEALNLDYLHDVLKKNIKDAGLERDLRIVAGRDHLKLIADSGVMFGAGAALSGEGMRVARALAERLGRMSNAVTLSVSSPGGWEESYAQAESVAGALRNAGYTRRMTVVGEGGGGRGQVELRVAPDDGAPR